MNDSASVQQNERFLSWLAFIGVALSHSICIADSRPEDRGRGIVAVNDIAQDEVLITIPRTAVLSPPLSVDTSLHDTLEALDSGDGQYER